MYAPTALCSLLMLLMPAHLGGKVGGAAVGGGGDDVTVLVLAPPTGCHRLRPRPRLALCITPAGVCSGARNVAQPCPGADAMPLMEDPALCMLGPLLEGPLPLCCLFESSMPSAGAETGFESADAAVPAEVASDGREARAWMEGMESCCCVACSTSNLLCSASRRRCSSCCSASCSWWESASCCSEAIGLCSQCCS